jgi:O-antigen/teichoic acid export membrane protein
VSAVIAFIYAEDFFRLWVGPEFVGAGPFPSTALVFRILLVGAVCIGGQRIGYQILLGSRRIRVLARLFVIEGILNIVLSVCLIPWFGLLGVAVGTVIPSCIFHGVVHPYVVARAISVPWRSYFREVLLKPLVLAGALAPVLYAIHGMAPVTNWALLVSHGVVSGMLALCLIVFVGLSSEERKRFLAPALEKLTRRRQPADDSSLIKERTECPVEE